MAKYIFIDNLGMRHATVKAKDRTEAYKVAGYHPQNVIAIREDELETFKKQVNRL
jgi:hypothetical protein